LDENPITNNTNKDLIDYDTDEEKREEEEDKKLKYDNYIEMWENYEELDETCMIDMIPNKSREKNIDYALSNAFAFGGLNAVLAFKKWKE
jgi:hypothetical protein